MGVLTGCTPRKEVLKTDLDDAIFAADFGDLIAGSAAPVYKDVRTFFKNTHPAKQLCKIAEVVFARLADPHETGATIRLSTGFGGGKTHTLMTLWHLAKNIDNPAIGTEVLPAAGRPASVTLVAIDASKAGVPVFAEHGSTRVRSLAGEFFYCLGGKAALKSLGEADDPNASPSEAQVQSIFPQGPVLILIDELVIYMAKLGEQGQGNLLGFLNSLASVVGKRPQTVLVVTDPAGQLAYQKQAVELEATLQSAKKLDEIFGRRMSDFDPIGDESARVIVRRLMESVDQAAAQATSASYNNLYRRVASESSNAIPPQAITQEYARRIVESYPFHPRLLDTAQNRLGALQDFQKSRGVLRLFARILRDTWESKTDCEIITAGELDWGSPRIQSDLLNRINRDSFKAAVSADIEQHAKELDGGKENGIHRRVASALLLESLPNEPSSGLDSADLTLAVLHLDEAGPEPVEAMDRLAGVCWHTYPLPGGRGWQFRYEPNIIKQVEERKARISMEDARKRVLSEAQDYFSGVTFRTIAWPTGPRMVPRSAELQLALCEEEPIARRVIDFEDDSDPQAPVPRLYKNALVGITASKQNLERAMEAARSLMAAEEIEREHKTGEGGKLIREQLKLQIPRYQKHFHIQARRAFDKVVLPAGTYMVEEKYQVSDEQIIQRAQGQACILKFLVDKGFIYQAGDSLDPERFLQNVLPGATPQTGKADVYSVRSVHERFLSAPSLRILTERSVVNQTINRAIRDGRIVIRLSDGRTYDSGGYVVKAGDGRRTRVSMPIDAGNIPIDESAEITRSDSDTAREWLAVDAEPAPGAEGKYVARPTAPPPPSRIGASTQEKILELSATRPLYQLQLTAITPAAAAALTGAAQPLGADTLWLSITVGGTLKDGGSVDFRVSEVKPNHAIRPLSIAQTIFQAVQDGSTYETMLHLEFSPPRPGMGALLKSLIEGLPEGVSVRAEFDRP